MVTGLEKFITHFEAYTDHYVLIGGAACDWLFTQQGLDFRATKDLDVVLIAEALDDLFVIRFWEFIRQGNYQKAEQGERQQFYRFQQPSNPEFPKMIELFSRRLDGIAIPEGFHLTPIPTGEDLSSLSAILLDEDYYRFLGENSVVDNGLRFANDLALVALKARAWMNNLTLQAEGHKIQSGDVKKHLNDVLRIATLLRPIPNNGIPKAIQRDMETFVSMVRTQNPEIVPIMRPLGLAATTLQDLLRVIERVFVIDSSSATDVGNPVI